MGWGRERQEGRDMCKYIFNSLCCTAKTNTTLKATVFVCACACSVKIPQLKNRMQIFPLNNHIASRLHGIGYMVEATFGKFNCCKYLFIVDISLYCPDLYFLYLYTVGAQLHSRKLNCEPRLGGGSSLHCSGPTREGR